MINQALASKEHQEKMRLRTHIENHFHEEIQKIEDEIERLHSDDWDELPDREVKRRVRICDRLDRRRSRLKKKEKRELQSLGGDPDG